MLRLNFSNRINWLGCLILLLIGDACQTEEARDPFFLGGIQVNEPDQKEWTSTLKEVGMNTVSVTVYARQGIWNGDNLWWNPEELNIINEIRAAKEQGMKVVLIPRILLDHYFDENSFLWHGMTMPRSDTLLNNWFDWYTVFVNTWAKICEEEKVDVMAIGSEMRLLSATQQIEEVPILEDYYLDAAKQEEYIADRMAFSGEIPPEDLWVRGKEVNYQSLEKYLQDEVAAKVSWAKEVAFADAPDPLAAINQRRALKLKRWHSLIDTIRQSYSGKLTYAANFDNYQDVGFWDRLDFIGINAYFKLRELQMATSDAEKQQVFLTSWNNIFTAIDSLRQTDSLSQKVIFTELGYIYRKNCTVMPWEGFGFSIATSSDAQKDLIVWSQQKGNLTERAMAVTALQQSNQEYDLLRGILYWKLTTKDYHIPYEPFVLHVKKEDVDPLQTALLSFLKKNK